MNNHLAVGSFSRHTRGTCAGLDPVADIQDMPVRLRKRLLDFLSIALRVVSLLNHCLRGNDKGAMKKLQDP